MKQKVMDNDGIKYILTIARTISLPSFIAQKMSRSFVQLNKYLTVNHSKTHILIKKNNNINNKQ